MGERKGKFRSTGRYASVNRKGRWWLTTDYCDRTVVRPGRARCWSRDLVMKKNVVVKAPESYSAQAEALMAGPVEIIVR